MCQDVGCEQTLTQIPQGGSRDAECKHSITANNVSAMTGADTHLRAASKNCEDRHGFTGATTTKTRAKCSMALRTNNSCVTF